jgi:hypothetical protein
MSIMQARNRQKVVKIVLSLIVVALATATLAQQPRRRVEIIGISVPAQERAGADDGAALAIHFTGDMHGSLQPCG